MSYILDIHKSNRKTIVDDNVYNVLKDKRKPFLSSNGYVAIRYKGSICSLHCAVANKPPGYDVHHINHNRFDNRKSNLKVVTKLEHFVLDRIDDWRIRYNYKHIRKFEFGFFKGCNKPVNGYVREFLLTCGIPVVIMKDRRIKV